MGISPGQEVPALCLPENCARRDGTTARANSGPASVSRCPSSCGSGEQACRTASSRAAGSRRSLDTRMASGSGDRVGFGEV